MLTSEAIFQKPGGLWTDEEYDWVVEDWLKERYRYFLVLALQILGSNAVLEDAEDTLHDVLLPLFRCRFDKYNPAKGTFPTYVHTCIRNGCLKSRRNIFKRAEREGFPCAPADGVGSVLDVAATTDDPEELLLSKELRDYLVATEYCEVLVLHYFKGLSIEEISNRRGISKTHAKVQLFRARQQLELRWFRSKNAKTRGA